MRKLRNPASQKSLERTLARGHRRVHPERHGPLDGMDRHLAAQAISPVSFPCPWHGGGAVTVQAHANAQSQAGTLSAARRRRLRHAEYLFPGGPTAGPGSFQAGAAGCAVGGQGLHPGWKSRSNPAESARRGRAGRPGPLLLGWILQVLNQRDDGTELGRGFA